MERFVNLFDAASLGLFCVGGTLKALEFGRGLYATPALLGATLIVLADWLDFADHPAVAPVAVVAAFGLRLVALIRGWNAPVARAG